jgi:hypothetical protein
MSYLEIFMSEECMYIATPRSSHRAERIDALLEKRMRDFLLARRQKLWHEGR